MFHGLKSLFHAANVQKIKNVSSVLTHFFNNAEIFFNQGITTTLTLVAMSFWMTCKV